MTVQITQRALFSRENKFVGGGTILQTGEQANGHIAIDGIVFKSALPNSELGAGAINATLEAIVANLSSVHSAT